MRVPKVVIVGRPNVGKSSVFNWVIGHRMAIVDPTAGVTRDRNSYLMEVGDRYFELIDTGGMGVDDVDGLTDQVEAQITSAIEDADVMVFMVDGHTGQAPLDNLVADYIRDHNRRRVPILLVVNKCDNDRREQEAAAEFFQYGYDPILVSAKANRHRQRLINCLLDVLPENTGEPPKNVEMKIAVVGKRNAGKSTFINHLAQSERMIVSEVPGTTRDSVDVRFEHDGKSFLAIDTAGVKRKRAIADSIEFYSFTRAQRTVRRADVVLFFIDPTTRISKVDKQLANYVMEQHKPCIFVINKWDLYAAKTATGSFDEYLDSTFPTLYFAPRVFTTATTGRNVKRLIDLAQQLFKQANERVTTGELNRVFNLAIERNAPPVRQNRRPKIFYVTQVGTNPPTLVLFCNAPKLFEPTYQRYLLNVCREELPFKEIPIKLYFRKRDSHTEQGDVDALGQGGETSNDRTRRPDELN